MALSGISGFANAAGPQQTRNNPARSLPHIHTHFAGNMPKAVEKGGFWHDLKEALKAVFGRLLGRKSVNQPLSEQGVFSHALQQGHTGHAGAPADAWIEDELPKAGSSWLRNLGLLLAAGAGCLIFHKEIASTANHASQKITPLIPNKLKSLFSSLGGGLPESFRNKSATFFNSAGDSWTRSADMARTHAFRLGDASRQKIGIFWR